MNRQHRRVFGAAAVTAGFTLALGPLAARAADGTAPSIKGFFTGLGQVVKSAVNPDPLVVRGYFDAGAPPRRYYCVIDAKTGAAQPNAVEGQLVPLGGGTMGIRVTSVSLLDCNKAQQNGMLVTTGYAPAAIPAGAAATAGNAAPSATASADTARWDILGVKLGDTADAAQAALRVDYPKIVRVDHEVHYTFQHFKPPPLVLGTMYVAGKAYSDKLGTAGMIHGAGELGDQSEEVDIEYVWPPKGAVVAIRRYHQYDYSRRFDPSTLPSVESLEKALTEHFGAPTATTAAEGTGRVGGIVIGGSLPTITWTWTDNPAALVNNQLPSRCDNGHDLQFSSRHDSAELFNPDLDCGVFLIVTVETIEKDYVETLTEKLVDTRALAAAYHGLQAYMTTGAAGNAAALKARADAKTPVL